MNIPETYDYLVRARRDLWTTLEGVPGEVLSRPLLDGARLHSLKDLVFHTALVEDCWLHEDILRDQPVCDTIAAFNGLPRWRPAYAGIPLSTLLDYWRAVEQSTLAYLARLNDDELQRIVVVHDAPEETYTVDGLLWHVMIHEMRHTAQIAVLLRTQGIEPPWMDLKNYLPFASPGPAA
jgi:uncharacterized damage-inducible protein DinB